MNNFIDAHYFQIPSQGNIYTLTNLQMKNNTNKILVAARKEMFLFDYPDNASQSLSPTTKEISFTYIPNGAEIISIDAYNKSNTKNEHVIGITIIKKINDDSKETYLNIYTDNDPANDFNIESIAQNCFIVYLNFIPYQLTHTNLPQWKNDTLCSNEIIFLLSGSDNLIHAYCEDKDKCHYKEMDIKDGFPEFYKAPSVVMWIHVQYYDNTERISAFGCECGYVRVSKVNCKLNEIISIISTRLPNTISNVTLFTDIPYALLDDKDTGDDTRRKKFNLLVTNTLIPSVVFKNVGEKGFINQFVLERTDCFNVFSCSIIADINFNGLQNILIGSREQELLFYKNEGNEGWIVKHVKKFAHPILSMLYLDVTGDGVKELIVSTTKGVHILQHNHLAVQSAIERNLKLLNVSEH